MIKLLIDNCNAGEKAFIQERLDQSSQLKFSTQYFENLPLEQISVSDFDVFIFFLVLESESSLNKLKQLLNFELSQPVIIITENFDETNYAKLHELGADDCLPQKELSSWLLIRSIQQSIHQKKTEAKLIHIAAHDRLTGLANRFLLHKYLENAVSRAKRNDNELSLLFVDLDKFQFINDSLGHKTGDKLLKIIGKKLLSCIRETDIVARLGNDEFAILLENSGSGRDIAKIAQKIQDTVSVPINIEDNEIIITASIGISNFPDCGNESAPILKSAELALRTAKQKGRNSFHFFTNELNQQAKHRLELEKSLRRALINCEFDVHLQPQINSETNRIVGAEALLRWNHPKFGFVSPITFIPLLEELGLLVGVESWVINRVCQLGKRLNDKYGPLRFSVNISGSHFKNGNLKENIYLALQASSLDALNLEVELTEDIMIEHVENSSLLLSELKEIGVSVALDDFGKGYSSLSYLKDFPADVLKIDKAFIDHLVSDNRDGAIVESLIKLSHKLGIKVVAEGVEEKTQLVYLQEAGCDIIQGYYFAKPMPIDEFEAFIASNISKSLQETSMT